MTTPPDALDLEELERLLAEATPGPWQHLSGGAIPDEVIVIPNPDYPHEEWGIQRHIHVARTTSVARPGFAYFYRRQKARDAAAIAALRNHGPALVRIARAALADVAEECDCGFTIVDGETGKRRRSRHDDYCTALSTLAGATLRAAGLLKEDERE